MSAYSNSKDTLLSREFLVQESHIGDVVFRIGINFFSLHNQVEGTKIGENLKSLHKRWFPWSPKPRVPHNFLAISDPANHPIPGP
jgi:hypothetical protein